ncbi:MAG: hypothetical protein EBX05_06270, partial [Rhodobacteraceae bacterium]|nr:hypothetical protein [Paracoccaceae bacterium]
APKTMVHVPLDMELVYSSASAGLDSTRSNTRPFRMTRTSSNPSGTLEESAKDVSFPLVVRNLIFNILLVAV